MPRELVLRWIVAFAITQAVESRVGHDVSVRHGAREARARVVRPRLRSGTTRGLLAERKNQV